MSRQYRDLAWKFFSPLFILLVSFTSYATQQDASRAAADKLIAEAEALTEKRTEESSQQAIEKYLAATSIWRSVNDKPMEAASLYRPVAVWRHRPVSEGSRLLLTSTGNLQSTGQPQRRMEHA
jgi:hypothetical protein